MIYKLVVVCGARTFNDKEYMRKKLREIKLKEGNLLVREGGAVGADFHARMLCYEEVWLRHEKTFRPQYKFFNRGAPLIRNVQMLETEPKPKIVIAFHDKIRDSGTSHTVTNARLKNIKVYEFWNDSLKDDKV